jgi:hypothetical protein
MPRLRLRVALVRTAMGALVASGLITAGLWTQMAAGRDPALATKSAPATRSASVAQVPATPLATDPAVSTVPDTPAPVVTATS